MTTVNEKLCYCGCGNVSKSNFIQGHDAKLKSKLEKVSEGLISVRKLPRSFVENYDQFQFSRNLTPLLSKMLRDERFRLTGVWQS